MINQGMMTSNRQDWETPKYLYDELDREFKFQCDLFAFENNNLHRVYFTEEHSCFDTGKWFSTNFANPPYETSIQNQFFKRAYEESLKGNTTVALVPARTDTIRFHEYVFGKENVEVRFLKGRVSFCINGQPQKPAPFPSCVIIWKPI